MRKRLSKKRSGTSSRHDERPDLPPIYLDESVCQGLLWQALTARGYVVYRRSDKFPAGVSDPEWLEVAGREQWLVLTKDQAITRRPNELLALENAGVQAFVLTAGEMTGPDQVALFEKLLPTMAKYVKRFRAGSFVIRVNRDRTTEVLRRKAPRRRSRRLR